jgi:hypothetical protein
VTITERSDNITGIPAAYSCAPPPVWVLTDRRPGNTSQALGVAEALDLPFAVKHLDYTRLVALPNTLAGSFRLGLTPQSRSALAPPWPALVISAGRRTARVARMIKRYSGGTSFLVQIMDPRHGGSEFDLIAVPAHDSTRDSDSIVRTLGAPTRIPVQTGAAAKSAESDHWRACFMHLPEPRIALMVGTAKRRRAGAGGIVRLAQYASAMARETGGSLLVTTSRRTRRRLAQLLEDAIDAPHHFHHWTRKALNPYAAYLALGDGFIVTGDSVSMCSEACGTGRPVYVFAEHGWAKPAHRRFHTALYERGIARPLAGRFETWPYEPVNAALEVARAIRARLALP